MYQPFQRATPESPLAFVNLERLAKEVNRNTQYVMISLFELDEIAQRTIMQLDSEDNDMGLIHIVHAINAMKHNVQHYGK